MNRRKIKRPGIHIFSKFILTMNIFAVCALLLSYLASFIDPEKFWVFSFFWPCLPSHISDKHSFHNLLAYPYA